MPRAVIITKESSLKGLVTDARLPYPSREVRLVSGQQQRTPPPQDPPAAGGKRIQIPRQSLRSSSGRIYVWPQVTVAFNHDGREISFRDIQRGSPSLLCSGDAAAFPSVSQDRAEFRTVWPGYNHVLNTFSLPTTIAGRPITRWQLACKVVEFYASFWEHARRGTASDGNEQWDVKAFDFDTLTLIDVSNTYGHDAVFQATIETVVFP